MYESLAVVGATGAVGKIIRQLLEERDFPIEKVTFMASARSAGSTLSFRGEKRTIIETCPAAFEEIDLVIASTPDEVSQEFVPWAVERNAVVVDESGYWRSKLDSPDWEFQARRLYIRRNENGLGDAQDFF